MPESSTRHHARWSSLSQPSWLYPLKGIYYFSSHRFLWPLLKARLLPCFLLSIFVYANLFVWTYIPQVLFLALFHWSGLAWFHGAVLVLGEGAAIVALLFEAFFVDETQIDVFDAVLVHEGLERLVSRKRVVLPSDGADAADGADGAASGSMDSVTRLGKHTASGAVYAPFSLRQIVEFVVFLPLTFIPWVGVPVFLILTGYRAGPFHHWRYYFLLDVTSQEKKELVQRRKLRYTWFGTVALMLQLVPGLSMLFLLTTSAGAALWVRDLEHGSASGLDDAATHDGYTDDPS